MPVAVRIYGKGGVVIRQNVHLNTTFYQRELLSKPNVRISKADATLEMVVNLVILGIICTACLVLWWPS